MRNQPIYLIGFMGCGKSTISKKLAGQLQLPYIEMDEILVKQFGKPITEVFADEGEEAFRQAETALIRKLGEAGAAVVSCGGGAAMRQENVRYMKEKGVVVLLQASPLTIYDRVKNSTSRPLLNGHMNVKYISDLMAKRAPFYEAAADLTVSVDGKRADQIVAEIRSLAAL